MKALRPAFACLILSIALPAAAILIRPDRDDAEYLELATRYPSAVLLNAPDGGGVLIAPRWILTAAHMVKALEELKTLPKITVGGRAYAIQRMVRHPDWDKMGPSDIGLIQLKTAVTGVKPTPIYRGRDEGGKTIVMVGFGYTGRIGVNAVKANWDRKGRAAINTIDRVGPRILGMQVKPASEASDLQGVSGPGDSGCPAYLETPDGFFVIGIGYATDDTNADRIIGNAGDWEIYARVSAFSEWIDATITKWAAE